MVKWDFVTPSLQVASGIAEVHYTEHISRWDLIARFKVRAEGGSIGYSSIEDRGVPVVVLEAVRPYLDILLRSYLEGVTMDKSGSCFWVDPSEIDEARRYLDKLNKKIEDGEYIFEKETSEVRELWRRS